jgi:pimeloyl-ACP methyl ester carboxylesterase
MHNPTQTSPSLKVVSDQGSGRAFITVIDDPAYRELAIAIAGAVGQRARAIVVETDSISPESWKALALSFEQTLASLNIRQASFIGIAAGATLIQNVALENPRVVRTLVIVDASLRPHPTIIERILDGIEQKLPFGLPLRLGSRGFNVRAFAHRLRCPMLLISTRRASSFISHELRELGTVAPTAWFVQLATGSDQHEAQEMCDLILAFQDTPAKCPQKNLQEAV